SGWLTRSPVGTALVSRPQAASEKCPLAAETLRVASHPDAWVLDLLELEPYKTSMVVGDFNSFWTLIGPEETNSILIIDTNAVLTFSVSCKCFKPVSRGNSQLIEQRYRIQLVQLPGRQPPQHLGASTTCCFGRTAMEDVFGRAENS